MATNTAHVKATVDEVYSVLADGWLYSNWVVGTSHIRAVTANWPAVGSKVFHASGIWPLVNRDETVVEQLEPGVRMVLTARARPVGEAEVIIELAPEATGTKVTMHETPVSGPGKWLNNPGSELVLSRRNAEALARLTAIAERRTRPAD